MSLFKPAKFLVVSWLSCLLAGFSNMTIAGEQAGSYEKVYPSFRVLSSDPAIPSEESVSPTQAVWLTGSIDENHPQNTARPLTENITLGYEQSQAHQSFDTTKLAAYQDDSSIVGRALNDADAALTAPVDSATPQWVLWKSTIVSGAWLLGSGDTLGTSNLNLSGKILFPNFPLATITPSYQMYFLNGPDSTDLPSKLHNTSVTFTGYIPFSDRWIGTVSVAPGITSDFQTGSSNQFRITGVGMMIFQQSDQLQWTFGVAYLDREDISLLPLAGVSWSPNDQVKVELIFPRPRVKWRLYKTPLSEKWGYVGAEFGGGSWAINRTNGTDDVVTLTEYRLLAGMESKLADERSYFWETGIVMGRSVEYSTGIGDYNPNTTFVLSGGITF